MWKKNFRVRKLQTVMIFIVILLCSMLMNGSFTILTSLNEPFHAFAKQCKAATLVLTPFQKELKDSEAIGEKLSALEHVSKIEYEGHKEITDEITSNGVKIDTFMYMTTYDKDIYQSISFTEGNLQKLETLNANEIMIPACISNEYDLHTNDQISIHFPSGEIIYTIQGVYSNSYNSSNAFSLRYFVNEYPEGMKQDYSIFVYADESVSGADLIDEYRANNNGLMPAYFTTIEDMESNTMLPGSLAGGIFLGISIILLLVSILIINFIIRNVMLSDARTVAIYKTMGYSYGDILAIYLKFYFVIVSVACLVGIGLSYLLSSIILNNLYQALGNVEKNYNPVLAIPCFVLVVGLVLAVIYQILRKMKILKPVVILGGNSGRNTKMHSVNRCSKVGFSSIGIALRDILTNKKGMLGILITSVATIFIINFATISLDVAYSVADNNDYWFGIDDADVFINISNAEDYDSIYQVVSQKSDVDQAIKCSLDYGNVSLKWEKGKTITNLNPFVYESYEDANFTILEGNNPKYSDEIAISTKVADAWNKKVGDYMDIYLVGNKKASLLITGIYQTYFSLGKSCRLIDSTFIDNGVPINYTYISVHLKDASQADSFSTNIKSELGNRAGVVKREDLFSNIMTMIVTPQKTAIPPVMIIIFLIGGVNIFSIVLLKNASNERTNGIYKCLGYSTGHMIRSNLWYVTIVVLLGIVIAIPIILFSYAKIMSICLSVFNLREYLVEYNVGHLVIANLGIIAAFIISTLISSLSIRKVKVQKLVQE